MQFNSFGFLCFLPAVLAGTFLCRGRGRQLWLLAASYAFYMGWNPKYVLLLAAYTLVTYACGRCIQRQYDEGHGRDGARKYAAAGIALCFGFLFVFKYFNFFLSTLETVCAGLGLHLSVPRSDLLLPVGISFFTFQSVGYLIDVYRRDIRAQESLLSYALFLSFFAQLVAGPIERSSKLMPQLEQGRPFCFERMLDGLLMMLWGYFLKVVIADRAAIFVDRVYGDGALCSGAMIALATVLFAFQIYGDFAGYSTIALGAARMLGIELTDNFESPYLAESVKEFWRGWHVSLNRWFRDYVYIPLGGNRAGKALTVRNTLVTFALSGLWHGANWTYVFWGVLNGLYQVPGIILSGRKGKRARMARRGGCLLLRGLRVLRTFLLVDISWLIFRASSLTQAWTLMRKVLFDFRLETLFDGSALSFGIKRRAWKMLALCILLLLAVDLCKKKGICLRRFILRRNVILQAGFTALVIAFILTVGVWGTGYDAAGFIYFQF